MSQDPAPVRTRRPEYLGDPTIGAVMRRPQWLLALLLAMIVAALFAWLGRWQMDNAIRTEAQQSIDFETPQRLAEIAAPGQPVGEESAGAVASTAGMFRADDLMVVAPRENAGETGAWVVAHLVGNEGGHLAVALGWAPDRAAAEAAAARLAALPELTEQYELEGRFMPSEGPVVPKPDEDPSLLTSMVPAQLINLWSGVDSPAYAGYLVLHPGAGTADLLEAVDLDAIDSVAPEPAEAVNWLNVFYAIEWVVFAGFAIFLWYRLARDAWEKEHERLLLSASGDAQGGEE